MSLSSSRRPGAGGCEAASGEMILLFSAVVPGSPACPDCSGFSSEQ